MKINHKKIYIYILFLLSISCVEHKFIIKVFPNGHYDFHYSGHGDRDDLLNHDFSIPTGPKWNIISTIDQNLEAETFDYKASRLLKKNESIPVTFFNSDSIPYQALLKHPMKIKHYNWFFSETYDFEWIFENRNVNNKYPLVTNLVKNPDLPPKGWIKETLYYLLNETLNQTNIDWNLRPIIKSSLDNWIKTIQILPDSIILIEHDYYKQSGLDIIMQSAPPNLYFSMDSIFQILESELEITLALMDDNFNHYVILPGKLEFSNSDSLLNDTLFWNFSIEDFINHDYSMKAKSKIVYNNRKIWGLIFLIVTILIMILRKKLI